MTTQPTPVRLNFHNPLHHFLLLRWIFFQPKAVNRYRVAHGSEDLLKIGSWLTMLYLWIPLMIPACAQFLGVAPLNKTVATIFLVSFSSSAWYIYTRIDLAGALLGVLFFHIHIIDKSAIDGSRDIALAGQFALIVGYSAAVIISNATVEPPFPTSAFIVMLAGVGTWVGWHVGGGGFVMGFFVGVLMALLWAPFVLESGNYVRRMYRREARPNFLPSIAAIISIIACGVLIWVYWIVDW